jgi:hypothetical protein
MKSPFAFILDGVPSDASLAFYWLRCVLIPATTICLAFLIARSDKKPVSTLVGLCVVAALVVLRPAYDLISWGYPFFPSRWFIAAPWIGASLPFAVLALLQIRPKTSHSAPPLAQRHPDMAGRHFVWSGRVASALGVAWLFYRYWWAHVGAEMKFVVHWSLLAAFASFAAIFCVRRLSHED